MGEDLPCRSTLWLNGPFAASISSLQGQLDHRDPALEELSINFWQEVIVE
jgi:hypothetical protein